METEIKSCLEFLQHVYETFGFTFKLFLSTRPDKYLGELEVWNNAEKVSYIFYQSPIPVLPDNCLFLRITWKTSLFSIKHRLLCYDFCKRSIFLFVWMELLSFSLWDEFLQIQDLPIFSRVHDFAKLTKINEKRENNYPLKQKKIKMRWCIKLKTTDTITKGYELYKLIDNNWQLFLQHAFFKNKINLSSADVYYVIFFPV